VTGDRVTAALERQAQTLHAAARAHKRSEFQHRKQARDLMRQLEELRKACEERGITLEIDTDPPKGGHSHG
jgi:hypothetical protein